MIARFATHKSKEHRRCKTINQHTKSNTTKHKKSRRNRKWNSLSRNKVQSNSKIGYVYKNKKPEGNRIKPRDSNQNSRSLNTKEYQSCKEEYNRDRNFSDKFNLRETNATCTRQTFTKITMKSTTINMSICTLRRTSTPSTSRTYPCCPSPSSCPNSTH